MKKHYRFVKKEYLGGYCEYRTEQWSFLFGWESVSWSTSSSKEEALQRHSRILNGAEIEKTTVLHTSCHA